MGAGKHRRIHRSPRSTTAGPAEAATGYARYIGRIGALAVALGVGTAVATGQGFGLGVARADDTGAAEGPANEAPAAPGPTAADGPTGVDATSPSNEAPAPVAEDQDADEDEDADDTTEANPYVPEMNYSGGVDTDDHNNVEPTEDQTPPAPPTDEATPPSAAPSQPQDQLPLEDTEDQDNSTPPAPPPPARDTDVVQGVVDDEDLSTTPDSDAPVHARSAVELDENTGAHTMQLSSPAPAQDSALTMAEADVTQAGPADALLGIPGAVVSVASTLVGVLLSPFLAPGPTAPAQPPLLFALLGWVQREIQRAFFNRTPDAVVDTVTTSEDTPKVIDVLRNDTDVDGDPISVTSYTQPAHGTVVQNPDGTLTYTPAPTTTAPTPSPTPCATKASTSSTTCCAN